MLSTEDIAGEFQKKTGKECHVTTVLKWLASGKLKGSKIGGHWFAEESDVKIFLSGNCKAD